MQLESLKVFCDVVRQRSFSQAARINEVTQSAASQIVGQLERRLGRQLIDRSTRPLQVTDAGRAYYDGCKRLIEQYLELEASIRDSRSEWSMPVQVAAIYSVGLSDMWQLIERFHELHPRDQVRVEYLHPDRVYGKVLEGTADLGLVSFPRGSRDLTAIPWREEEMVIACSPGHSLACQRAVSPEQLSGQKYIGFDKGLVIRREVDRYLREQGITVDVAMEFDNIENIKKAIEEAVGTALLPEPTLRREIQAGTLVARPLGGPGFVRPLGIIHRRQQPLSTAAARFVELLSRSNDHLPAVNGAVGKGTAPHPPTNTPRRQANGRSRPRTRRKGAR